MLKVEDYKGKMYIVHCKTQLEWDYITQIFNKQWSGGKWSTYKENTYIYLDQTTYGNIKNPDYGRRQLLQASDFMKEKTIDYEIY